MLSARRFVVGTRFRWQGNDFDVKMLLPDNRVNIQSTDTLALSTISVQELVGALFNGELVLVNSIGTSVPQPVRTLADYNTEDVERARFRFSVIEPLTGLSPATRTEELFKARASETGVGVASVYRWIADYEKNAYDLRSLIYASNARGGKDGSRLHPAVDAIVQNVVNEKYLRREKTPVKHIVREIALRVSEENNVRLADQKLDPPGRKAVTKRIEQLGLLERFQKQYGTEAAKRTGRQYNERERPQFALEQVEIDHTKADFIVVDESDNLPLGRLTVTTMLDRATAFPLGLYLGFDSGYYPVMSCMHHAICPKSDARALYGTEHEWNVHGIPFALIVDNGKEFVGRDLFDACEALGTQIVQTPGRSPHFKGKIERFFRTMNTSLMHTLPGTVFSNPHERADYASMKQACVGLNDLERIIHIFVLDEYAQEMHEGIGGVPAQAWQRQLDAGFSPRLPTSAEELRILLGRVDHRVLWHYGIEYENLRFNSAELVPLRLRMKGERVKIKIDPSDLSLIHVYDPFESRYVAVPALAQEYTSHLSLWKHRVICNFLSRERDQVDMNGLAQARRKIEAIVQEARGRAKGTGRSRSARWSTTGKSLVEMTPVSDARPTLPVISSPNASDDQEMPLPRSFDPLDLDDADGWEADYSLGIR